MQKCIFKLPLDGEPWATYGNVSGHHLLPTYSHVSHEERRTISTRGGQVKFKLLGRVSLMAGVNFGKMSGFKRSGYTFSFLLSVTKSGHTYGQTLRPPHFMAEKNIPLFSYQKKEVETSIEMLLEVQSPGKGENNRAIKGRPHPSSLSLSQEPFPLD